MSIVSLLELLIGKSYGYIDPGSGSIIIQMILGAIAGTAVAIKLYWFKLKSLFVRPKKNEMQDDSASPESHAEDDKKVS